MTPTEQAFVDRCNSFLNSRAPLRPGDHRTARKLEKRGLVAVSRATYLDADFEWSTVTYAQALSPVRR